MNYCMGIDVGTSGVKAVLYAEDGVLVASASEGYAMYQPQNGWAEQNPEDWWEKTVLAIRRVLASSQVKPEEISGLGLTGQMHGLVMLDQNCTVLRNAILWCDQRTAQECKTLTSLFGYAQLIAVTANPALTGFTASKILWVKKHEPELFSKCRHILLPKDYIRFCLTGDFATDVSDASGMQLLDVKNRCWSVEMLDCLQLNPSMLARVYESPQSTGIISKQAAQLTGLSEHTKVVAGAGDNAAAAVGTGVVCDKKAFTTIGTSGVVFAHTNTLHIDPNGRVHTFCCAVPGAWHVMGVTQAAGLSLKWLKENVLCDLKALAQQKGTGVYQLMDHMALQSPIGANRLLFLPYLMGERTPHLDPDCRGVFFGLSAMHTRSDLIRAVMEGVACSLTDCLSVLQEMGIKPDSMALCGGGANSPVWRQMLADLFYCRVNTMQANEGAAQGAAILATVGSGLFKTVQDACNVFVKEGEFFPPSLENAQQYSRVYAQYKALYPALRPLFKDLGKL